MMENVCFYNTRPFEIYNHISRPAFYNRSQVDLCMD